MGRRTYLSDVAAMALLYRKENVNTDMISYDKILEFDKIINENLEKMKSDYGVKVRYGCFSKPDLFVMLNDETGKLYAVMVPDVKLQKEWLTHIRSLPTDIIVAAQAPNALNAINLELVDGKLINIEEEKAEHKAI